jgi:hypothetical protein
MVGKSVRMGLGGQVARVTEQIASQKYKIMIGRRESKKCLILRPNEVY